MQPVRLLGVRPFILVRGLQTRTLRFASAQAVALWLHGRGAASFLLNVVLFRGCFQRYPQTTTG